MSEGEAVMGFGVRASPPRQAIQEEHLPAQRSDRASAAAALYAPPRRQYLALIFMLAAAMAIYFGWYSKGEQHLTAESGLGYLLGILGGALMLLLLLYPLRKRFRSMRWLGATKHWFRFHMVLGILGPVLILFHANFTLGSFNSRIALISMLLVAGSGLVGRYIYLKIHYSLYGRRLDLAELREIAEDSTSKLGEVITSTPELVERLRRYESLVVKPPISIFHSVVRIMLLGLRTRIAHAATRRILKRAIKKQASLAGWNRREKRRQAKEARKHLALYFVAARKVVSLGFYERLFALWHVLHVPLFFILVITTVLHVIAVHMY